MSRTEEEYSLSSQMTSSRGRAKQKALRNGPRHLLQCACVCRWEFPQPRVYRLPPRMEEECPPAKKQKVEGPISTGNEHPQTGLDAASSQDKEGEKSLSDDDASYLMEKDVGVTEYVSPQLPGFFGILKQRWMQQIFGFLCVIV